MRPHDPIRTPLPAPTRRRRVALPILRHSTARHAQPGRPPAARHPPLLARDLALRPDQDAVERDVAVARRAVAARAARVDDAPRVRRPVPAADVAGAFRGRRARRQVVVVVVGRPAVGLVVLGDDGFRAHVRFARRSAAARAEGAGCVGGAAPAAAGGGVAGGGVGVGGLAGAVARGDPVEDEDGEEDCGDFGVIFFSLSGKICWNWRRKGGRGCGDACAYFRRCR